MKGAHIVFGYWPIRCPRNKEQRSQTVHLLKKPKRCRLAACSRTRPLRQLSNNQFHVGRELWLLIENGTQKFVFFSNSKFTNYGIKFLCNVSIRFSMKAKGIENATESNSPQRSRRENWARLQHDLRDDEPGYFPSPTQTWTSCSWLA